MEKNEVVKAYKALNRDWTCRGFKYEIGQTYTHAGSLVPCESGFHACENPFDVLNYYPLLDSVFVEVELSGEIKRTDDKLCAEKIKIVREINMCEFINVAVEQFLAVDKTVDGVIADSGDYARIGSSGYSAKIGSSGDYARIGSSGDSARIGSSGYSARIGSSGDYAQIGSSGDYAQIGSSGDYAQIDITGQHSVAAAVAPDARIKAAAGTPIALCHYEDGKPVRFVCGVAGQDGLKADTWYELNAQGELVEVK